MNKKFELKALAADSIIQIILQIAFLSFSSHYVGPEYYGPFSLALLIVNLIKNFGLSGISLIILREKNNDKFGAVTGLVIFSSLLLSTPFFIFSSEVASALGSPASELPIFILGSTLVVTSLSLILESYLIKVGLIIQYVVINFITILSNAVCFILLIGSDFPSYMWLTYSYLISILIRMLLLLGVCNRRLSIFNPFAVFNLSKLKSVLHDFSGISVITIFNSLALNVDTFIVSRYLGDSNLGVYTRAFQINNYISAVYTKLISKLGVKAYALCESECEIKSNFQRIYIYTSFFSIVMSVIISSNANIIVPVLFGDGWLELIPALQIISLSIAFRLLYKAVDTYLLAFNLLKSAFFLQVFMFINVVLFVFFAQFYGLLIVCFAILAVTILQCLMSFSVIVYFKIANWLLLVKVLLVFVLLTLPYILFYRGLEVVIVRSGSINEMIFHSFLMLIVLGWICYVFNERIIKKNFW